jgi:hypothetical protein
VELKGGEGHRVGRRRGLGPPGGEEFDQPGEHLVLVAAFEGERQLSVEKAVFDTDVVAAAREFGSQVTFLVGRRASAPVSCTRAPGSECCRSSASNCITSGVSTCIPKKQR